MNLLISFSTQGKTWQLPIWKPQEANCFSLPCLLTEADPLSARAKEKLPQAGKIQGLHDPFGFSLSLLSYLGLGLL